MAKNGIEVHSDIFVLSIFKDLWRMLDLTVTSLKS